MTQVQRDSAFDISRHQQSTSQKKALWELEGGSGTVPAEVREMLDEHSMTKTDGPKKRGQLNMSPLSEEGGEAGG